MPENELEAWIPLKAGLPGVRALGRPDLLRDKPNELARTGFFADDPPGVWAGDEVEVPLWLYTLSRALSSAVFVPPWLDLAEAVRLVEPDEERRNALSVMARLGVFHSGDVILALIEWRETA